MTEDARPIPDRIARELRALNDLELGALFADLGVDPLKPPGAKLRGALAAIAEDPRPWWEETAAGHAVDCLAKEPRRGRIAGGGAVDHARQVWHGLATLGAAARELLPDPQREGEAAGVRAVIGAMEAELRAIRDFTGRADAVEGAKLLADEVAARGAALARWRDFADAWCGTAGQDDAARIAAVRERLRALASGAEDLADELAKARRARKSLEGRFAAAHEEGRLEAAAEAAKNPAARAWREWAQRLAGWPAPSDDAKLREILEGTDRRAEVTKEAIELRGLYLGAVEQLKAIADELGARQIPPERLAGMVRKIREAAGPTTLSGPGALAEQVARLRDLAGANAADLIKAINARDALREIDALTRG